MDTMSPRIVQFDQLGVHGRVLVVDEGDFRHLRFKDADASTQSMLDLRTPSAVPMDYIALAYLGCLLGCPMRRALVIGLGGGSLVRLMRATHPKCVIDIVEYDPTVVAVAESYFSLNIDSRMRVSIDDGAAFLRESEQVYDFIFVDAYDSEGYPEHFADGGFYSLLRTRVGGGGTAGINFSLPAEQEQRQVEEFSSTFAHVGSARTSDNLNLLMFGSESPQLAHNDVLQRGESLVYKAGISVHFDEAAWYQTLPKW